MATFSSGATLNDAGEIVRTETAAPPPPAETPPDEEGVQPDVAGESADAEPSSDAEPAESEEDAAVSEPAPRATRPFVARVIRENERLKRDHAAQAAQIEYLTRQLTSSPATSPQPQPAQESPRASDPPRPNAATFQSHEEYVEALTDWKLDQRERQRSAQEAQQRDALARQTAQQEWARREAEGRDAYDDYDEVVSRLSLSQNIAPIVADTFRESDVGPALLYYLGQHPKDVQHLNSLSPLAAARWLGQLETRVAPPPAPSRSRRSSPAQPGGNGAPPATPPMPPVNAGGAVPVAGFRQGMSLGEYERMRSQQRIVPRPS